MEVSSFHFYNVRLKCLHRAQGTLSPFNGILELGQPGWRRRTELASNVTSKQRAAKKPVFFHSDFSPELIVNLVQSTDEMQQMEYIREVSEHLRGCRCELLLSEKK